MKKTANGLYLSLFIILLVLMSIRASFHEGWALVGYPHCYQVTALQCYLDRPINENTVADTVINDNRHLSPLYPIAVALGHLGEPEPPWFRMAGLPFFVLLLIAAYLIRKPEEGKLARWITMCAVATTPVILLMGRNLEDHILHLLAIIVVAAILYRSDFGTRKTIWWILPIPALLLLATHMVTNFLLMMSSVLSMWCYTILLQIRKPGSSYTIRNSLTCIVATGVLVFAIVMVRWHDQSLSTIIAYYSQQIALHTEQSITWWQRLCAYPSVLLFDAAGLLLCSLAVANIIPRLRGNHTMLWLSGIIPPLILLTIFTKKHFNYSWYLAPLIALLASETLLRLGKKAQTIACALLCALCFLQFFGTTFSSSEFIVRSPFQSKGMPLVKSDHHGNYFDDMDWRLSRNYDQIFQAVAVCGFLEKRPLIVYNSSTDFGPDEWLFYLLYDHPDFFYPYYTDVVSHLEPDLIAVELMSENSIQQRGPNNIMVQVHQQVVQNLPLAYEAEPFRIYCNHQ